MTIKELRTEKKLTQKAFADAIGVSVISVRAYEAGRTRPSAKVLSAIKSAYGTDVELAAKPAEAKPAAPKKAAAKKAAKPVEKKAAAPKKPAEAKAAAPKKAAAKKRAKKEPKVIIQSPLGGEITPFAVLAKTGEVDKVYIRVDLNKAFWVKGDKTGSVDLW